MRLDELAGRLGCELHGDGSVDIRGVATLEEAQAGFITFLANPRYAPQVAASRASAIIVASTHGGPLHIPALRAREPYAAFAKALAIFHQPPSIDAGVHSTAVIHPGAHIGAEPSIGPYVTIGAGARIGDRCRIASHVVIGAETEIGDDFVAHAHASVRERCRIGHRVILQNGAVIGGDGFGYAMGDDGRPVKIVQAGIVVLEDDVEIGANATIDRATVGATRIRRGAKIDNLVQVAHGCDVGENCFVAAQAGLAGSSKLGRFVQLGGQVGLAGHLELGDFVRVAAQSGVPNDVPAGKTISGYPAVEIAVWRRISAALPRLPEVIRRLRRIERALKLGE